MDKLILHQSFVMSEWYSSFTRSQRRLADKLHESVSCKVPLYLHRKGMPSELNPATVVLRQFRQASKDRNSILHQERTA